MDKTHWRAAGLLSLSFFLLGASPLTAEDYFDDFATTYPYNTGFELAGQNGWEISDSSSFLTFFVQLNGSYAGAFGDFHNTPFTNFTRLSHPVDRPLDHAFLKLVLSLQTFSTLQTGEKFSLFIAGPQAENILSLDFEHQQGSTKMFNVYWRTGSSAKVDSKLSLSYGAPYTLEIQFPTIWTPGRRFKATLTGKNSLSFTGVVPDAPLKTWSSVGFDFVSAGATEESKFLVFDSLRAGNLTAADSDSDGFRDDCELFFGTDPQNAGSKPVLQITPAGQSAGTVLSFPSVVGNTYLIERSEDLVSWTRVTVQSTANPLVWTDLVPSASGRRFYRVGNP